MRLYIYQKDSFSEPYSFIINSDIVGDCYKWHMVGGYRLLWGQEAKSYIPESDYGPGVDSK